MFTLQLNRFRRVFIFNRRTTPLSPHHSDLTASWIREIDHLALSTGAKFVLCHMPTFASLDNGFTGAEEELTDLIVPYISLRGPLEQAMNGDLHKLLFKLDPHYNAYANQAIADFLFSELTPLVVE